jgi:hypothetical protein
MTVLSLSHSLTPPERGVGGRIGNAVKAVLQAVLVLVAAAIAVGLTIILRVALTATHLPGLQRLVDQFLSRLFG